MNSWKVLARKREESFFFCKLTVDVRLDDDDSINALD
jgi:hypothetical protein